MKWRRLGSSAASILIGTGMLVVGLLMVGTYVSDQGLRIRTPLRTLDVRWRMVLAVRAQKIIRANDKFVVARQVCLDLVDGQTVELPIHGVRRGEPRSVRMPDILAAAEFDRLVAELRRLTAHYQTGGAAS